MSSALGREGDNTLTSCYVVHFDGEFHWAVQSQWQCNAASILYDPCKGNSDASQP